MAKKYWVVSPNVKDNEDTIDLWKKESIERKAAFMGYGPDDDDHGRIGPKFAGVTEGGIGGIQPGHVILIARRKDGKPDVVGFGVVQGKPVRKLKGFSRPGNEDFGSMRKLQPFRDFKDCRKPPRGLFKKVLRHIQALVQRYPEDNDDHKNVCDWMDRYLGIKDRKAGEKQRAITKSRDKRKLGLNSVIIVDPPQNHQSGYKVHKKSEVIKAVNIEAKLLRDYRNWLEKKGHELKAAYYHDRRLMCDGCEVKRQNLIEAKASTSRENIRMAVGQLLDYAFLGKEKIRDPNMAILLPKEPDSDLIKWLQHLHISIIWREGGFFLDNADGRFL